MDEYAAGYGEEGYEEGYEEEYEEGYEEGYDEGGYDGQEYEEDPEELACGPVDGEDDCAGEEDEDEDEDELSQRLALEEAEDLSSETGTAKHPSLESIRRPRSNTLKERLARSRSAVPELPPPPEPPAGTSVDND